VSQYLRAVVVEGVPPRTPGTRWADARTRRPDPRIREGTTTPATRVHHGPSRAERPAGPAIGLSPSGLLRAPHLRLLWGAPNGTKQDRRSPE